MDRGRGGLQQEGPERWPSLEEGQGGKCPGPGVGYAWKDSLLQPPASGWSPVGALTSTMRALRA